jgi:peptidyl-prolyl cis-trans isomerase C
MRPPAAKDGTDPSGIRQRLDEMILTEVLYLEGIRRGVDRDPEIRRALRQLVVQKLLEEEVDQPTAERRIAEEELKTYYDGHTADFNRPAQVRLADIFLAAPEKGDRGVREKRRIEAEDVLAKALKLQDARFGFGELLVAVSDVPAGYPRGDTGFIDREGKPVGIAAALAEAGFRIERPGEIARDVIGTPDGWHVVMLVGRRDAVRRPFDDHDVRAEIEGRIRSEERRRLHEELTRTLRAKAEVSIEEKVLGELIAGSVKAASGGARSVPAPSGGPGSAPPAPPGGQP